MAVRGQFGGVRGTGSRGSAPTSASYGRASGEGARLRPMPAPGDEGGIPWAGGTYIPGNYANPTYFPNSPSPYYFAAGDLPFPLGGGGPIEPPPEPPVPPGGGGLGNLIDLALWANRLRNLPNSTLGGGLGELAGSTLGPEKVTKLAEVLGVDPASWMGANMAYGAGDVAAAVPGLEWGGMNPYGYGGGLPGDVLAAAGGDPSAAIGYMQGDVSAGVPGLKWGKPGAAPSATVAPPPLPAGGGPTFAPRFGGEGMGVTPQTTNMYGYAIPAAMMAYAGWSDANEDKKRREAAARYATDVKDANRTKFSDDVSGFGASNDRYWLEMPKLPSQANAGDFRPERYIDRSIASGPISTQQYTGSYTQPQGDASRTAVELTGASNPGAVGRYIQENVNPVVQWAKTAPNIGANDQGQEEYSAWAAKTFPGQQRYAMDMRTGEKRYLADGEAVPTGYELAPNQGYGVDPPKMPQAPAKASQSGRGTPSIGGGQGGSTTSNQVTSTPTTRTSSTSAGAPRAPSGGGGGGGSSPLARVQRYTDTRPSGYKDYGKWLNVVKGIGSFRVDTGLADQYRDYLKASNRWSG